MRQFFGGGLLVVFLGLSAFCVHAADRSYATADRHMDGFWQTERGRFLDSDMLREDLAAALKNPAKDPLPGTGTDPHADAQGVADEIMQMLFDEQKEGEGVNIETTLTALGALAGFSCQMAIRENLVASGRKPLKDVLKTLRARTGDTYYSGPLLNACLAADGEESVWSYVGGAALSLNRPLPDLAEVLQRTTDTLGSEKFGEPKLPAEHLPRQTSQALLWKYWNVSRNILAMHKEPPAYWPFIFGMAAQQLIFLGKDIIDPTLAARIVMEAAVPMAHIDPTLVYAAYLK